MTRGTNTAGPPGAPELNTLTQVNGSVRRGPAAMRADECLAAGDMEGEAVWLRIVKAIEELLSEERPGDAEVH